MVLKVGLTLEKVQLFIANRLLKSIAERKTVQKDQSEFVFDTLLPTWNQLVASRGTLESAGVRASNRALLLKQLPAEDWSLVPSLEKRAAPVMNTWVFQNEVMKWDIRDSELVLDVGSGGWPFKRANHLADKYPDHTTHRAEALARDQRPFFEVDLQHLPFEDRVYDFVFCSHVLEHLDNPGQAIRELMRVGRRGYIEVPTRLSDVMFNFARLPNHHRWHGLVQGQTLVLTEWNEWERRDFGNQYFDALHSEYQNGFQDFFERNRDMFFASCLWDGAIQFVVIDKNGKVIDSSEEPHDATP